MKRVPRLDPIREIWEIRCDYVELEGSSCDEESDVELSESLSTTSGSNNVPSGFDSDDSSTDNERAGRDAGGETPNLSETESDSVPQTDDEELASGASGKQERTKKIVYETRDILDLFGTISSSSAFIVPTRLQTPEPDLVHATGCKQPTLRYRGLIASFSRKRLFT
jgi:hypothetical protein